MKPSMELEGFSEPDSTTAEREFAVNDDVLCQIRGDQMYLGVVVQVNHIIKQCLVKFLDDTETWCSFTEMKLFGVAEEEVTCVVCKSSQPSLNNQVQVCACGRAYHQRCHEPPISNRDLQWKCRICCPERQKSISERQLKERNSTQPGIVEKEPRCGKCNRKNAWFRGMFQCRRCRVWFHSSCVHNINPPCLLGDRFFIFVCGGCNRGREFCARFALNWMDLIHIVLFNLTKELHTNFHDLDKHIMPFINKVWHKLLLPPEMANLTENERRNEVYKVLQHCPNRFRCGREDKKRVALYGLRKISTPRQPAVILPERGPVDDYVLGLKKKIVLLPTEKPLQNGHINSSRKEMETEDSDAPPLRKPKPKVGSSTEFLVKRSVPFPLIDASNNADTRFRSNAVRRAARLLRKRPSRPKQDTHRMSDSEDEALRTLMKDPSRSIAQFVPKADDKKQKKVVNKRPQRNLLEARLNSTESKLYNPQAATPQESPSKKKDKKKLEITKSIVTKTKNGKLKSGHLTEADSSGDEPIGLMKSVITRRLSEKDIVVDRQGVVRRKRRARRHSVIPPPPTQKYASLSSPTAPIFSLDGLYNSKLDSSYLRDYLCPMQRIAQGDPCKVITRRVKPNGEVYIMVSFNDSSSTS